MTFDTDPTHTATTAAEAFALKRGVCQDLTHVFIATARHLGIPARYVGGYFHRADGVTQQDAGHAWAEAYRARARLGGVRSGQRHLRDRRACARRGRAGLSRCRPGARRPARWRHREHGRQASWSTRPPGRCRADRMSDVTQFPCCTALRVAPAARRYKSPRGAEGV